MITHTSDRLNQRDNFLNAVKVKAGQRSVTQPLTHLSAEGGREAIIKSQQAVVLHHMDGHPHHPPLHLLLGLQVHLEQQSSVSFNASTGACSVFRKYEVLFIWSFKFQQLLWPTSNLKDLRNGSCVLVYLPLSITGHQRLWNGTFALWSSRTKVLKIKPCFSHCLVCPHKG